MIEPKVILFSQVPLPYSKIGSWTTLYDNYLTQNKTIDIIICPVSQEKYLNINYAHFSMRTTFLDKISYKLKFKEPWYRAVDALKKSIHPETKYIIHIIDNYGLCIAVSNYLEKNKIRKNFYIHYFYHGFPTFESELLYSRVDELTLLTNDSYGKIKKNVSTFPCRISVQHNGIDTSKFYTLDQEEKQNLRASFGIEDKKIFIWCSQDRPKKGLPLILDAWNVLCKHHKNIELWIVGTEKKQNTDSIKYFGRVPNTELAKYYQASDVYLFSTLCQEGFGMSLIEAKHSGCYCIASALGGVPEVLGYGTYGKLIENPNFVIEWINAVENYLKGDFDNTPFPGSLYSKEAWNENMNVLIAKAKERIKN